MEFWDKSLQMFKRLCDNATLRACLKRACSGGEAPHHQVDQQPHLGVHIRFAQQLLLTYYTHKLPRTLVDAMRTAPCSDGELAASLSHGNAANLSFSLSSSESV
jgi:hypothetical protein